MADEEKTKRSYKYGYFIGLVVVCFGLLMLFMGYLWGTSSVPKTQNTILTNTITSNVAYSKGNVSLNSAGNIYISNTTSNYFVWLAMLNSFGFNQTSNEVSESLPAVSLVGVNSSSVSFVGAYNISMLKEPAGIYLLIAANNTNKENPAIILFSYTPSNVLCQYRTDNCTESYLRIVYDNRIGVHG